ncbi:MAG TPA: ATP-binding protein [Chitinophagales bacterium]|jgi:predicted AAA+ superfamily ATPase|nr:ATP-binding protein [Chitinophagales bacterium]HQV77798.1 ATP-binding protein [Chitinophagales bacterium]HQW78272.1 ATP-binding protein [Chitinophagales bacterium]
MIIRKIEPQILRLLKEFPAVAILGPRQVGKTTLAKSLSKKLKKEIVYIDLERKSQFDNLALNAEKYLETYIDDCVVLDEIQRLPELFPLLRALIDEKRVPARFILTGSASPDLLRGASESLAGRISYSYLHPVGLHELPDSISMKQHWVCGGFPQHLTLKNTTVRNEWMNSFITTYIERDLPFLFDIKFSTVIMRKLWTMLAHLQSGILNAEDLGRSLDITGTTLKRYLDYLEGAFIITRLQPFFINIGKRLVKSPKIYINDTGILHFLLNISDAKQLVNHPSLGASWETYVISQISYAKYNRIDTYFYRTHVGAECDLVLSRGHIVHACIEIKYSSSPTLSKGFYQCIEDLQCKHNFVIIPDDVDYLFKKNIRIVGLQIFINKYLPKIK